METNRGNKQYQENEQQNDQRKWQEQPGKNQEQSIERTDVGLDKDEDLQIERKPSKERFDQNERSQERL